MEDKSIRVSTDTHKKLVEYVINNPLVKLNKFADIAISEKIQRDQEFRERFDEFLKEHKKEYG